MEIPQTRPESKNQKFFKENSWSYDLQQWFDMNHIPRRFTNRRIPSQKIVTSWMSSFGFIVNENYTKNIFHQYHWIWTPTGLDNQDLLMKQIKAYYRWTY